jgi:hypothetical protein
MKRILASIVITLASVAAFGQFNSPVPNQGALAAGSWIVPYSQVSDEFSGTVSTTTGAIGALGWDKTVIVAGTNPVAAAASVAGHPGLIELGPTDGTATNGVNITLGHAVGFSFPGTDTNWQSEFIFAPSIITTTNLKVGFMTLDNAAVIPTTGVYVRWLQGTDLSMVICSDTSSTETCGTGSASTGVVPAAGDYVDVYLWSNVSTTINYKIVDVTGTSTGVQSVSGTICPSGCTVTATIPTTIMSPAFQISGLSTGTPNLLVDAFYYASTVAK